MRHKEKELINRFFFFIDHRDIDDLIDLFDENCIVIEPFSNTNGLKKKI
ncbi:MAG: hypothetical protein ACE5SW_07505 [Nitrososphaeraceae archaeon]